MSEGQKIASLYAQVGFKMSEEDINKIKQALTSLKETIDELVKRTAEFATTLTRLSKSTGISPKLLQDFHNLGVEAGIATDEVDSMLETMANVANKAYWGLGNQYAQWGLFFGRGETAASALLKTLNKLNISSPQKQREIANELGLQLDAALMLADKLKKSGFKTEDYFNLSDKEVDTMHSVNLELKMMEHRVDGFWKKLTATQGENQLRNLKAVQKVVKSITTSIIDAAKTTTGNTLLDSFVTGVQILEPIFSQGQKLFGALKTAFSSLKYLGFGALVGTIGFIVSKLASFNTSSIFTSMQSWLDDLTTTGGKFGKDIQDAISTAADYVLRLLHSHFKNIADILGLTEFLEGAKKGNIFSGLGKLLDIWWRAATAGLKALLIHAKNLALYVWDIVSGGLEKIIAWAWETLNYNVFMPLMLRLYKALNGHFGFDFSEEIEELEQGLLEGPEALAKRLNRNARASKVAYDIREEGEQSIYDAVLSSLMGDYEDYKKTQGKRSQSMQSGLKQQIVPTKETRENRRNLVKYYQTQNLLNNLLPNDIVNNSTNTLKNNTYVDHSTTNVEINEAKTPQETSDAVLFALSNARSNSASMQDDEVARMIGNSSRGGTR